MLRGERRERQLLLCLLSPSSSPLPQPSPPDFFLQSPFLYHISITFFPVRAPEELKKTTVNLERNIYKNEQSPSFFCLFTIFCPPKKLIFELSFQRSRCAIWRFSGSLDRARLQRASDHEAARPGSGSSGDAAPRSKGERHQPDRTNRKRERSPRRSPPIPIERPSLLSQDESRTR